MDIIRFIRDPELINGALSPYQETAIRLLYGHPLDAAQKAIAQVALGTEEVPQREYGEATFICGRRSGKSDRIAANVAIYEAAVGGHEKFLARGERGQIVIVAQDKRGARNVMGYALAKLEGSRILSQLIQGEPRAEEIDLTNGLSISIFACSFRSTRGFSVPVAILDELAFFRHEGAVIDKQVIDAIRPAQATFPRSKLIKISSPYSKTGELYRDFSTRHRRPELLCFHAKSDQMNPTLKKEFLDAERERDPEFFEREYGAEFSDDIATLIPAEVVQDAVREYRELPPQPGVKYTAAVDAAAGGADMFTASVAHKDGERIVVDWVKGWRATKPESVVAEIVELFKPYQVRRVVGDRFAGSWVRDSFARNGITYDLSRRNRSEIYLDFLPILNQGRVDLPNDPILIRELRGLERRTSRSGRDSVDHLPGAHDDYANATALAAVEVGVSRGKTLFFGSLGGGPIIAVGADGTRRELWPD